MERTYDRQTDEQSNLSLPDPDCPSLGRIHTAIDRWTIGGRTGPDRPPACLAPMPMRELFGNANQRVVKCKSPREKGRREPVGTQGKCTQRNTMAVRTRPTSKQAMV